LLSVGIPQVRSTARIGGISFNEVGIELVLADKKTEAVTEARRATLMTIV
jgi:hypothetical protein